MKLTLAVSLILVELGTGVLWLLPLVPMTEVRRSFFVFHSMLAGVCFALATGLHLVVLDSRTTGLGLLAATLLCAVSFGVARLDKLHPARWLHLAAGGVALAFGIVGSLLALAGTMRAAHGADAIPAALVVVWIASAVLGALLLGAAHDAMALGHWYLISRNLSFSYLVRITKALLGIIAARTIFLVVALALFPVVAPSFGESYRFHLFSTNGDLMFFLMRVLWGLLLPALLAVMAWRCAVGKANMAATGLLYLCEFCVLFGELFAAYLLV